MYRLVIFDFDGTLADSADWFLHSLDDLADRFGFRKVERHEIDMLRGWSSRQILAHLRVPLWKVPAIARHMRELVARDAELIPLFPSIPRMLASLHRKDVRLAIVSSNSEANVRRILGAETASLVHFYDCGASLFGKAAKFRKVLKAAAEPFSDTIAIGDEIRDIEAAREAGIAVGAVAWGYNKPEALEAQRPDHLFRSVADVTELFSRS